MENSKQLVIKVGTEVLVSKKRKGNKFLNQRIFNAIASQIVEVGALGFNTPIVSSAAIQAGREKIEELEKIAKGFRKAHLDKKELAGIGARHLMNMWGEAFRRYGKEVAQVWVTYANWASDGERQSILSAIRNYNFQHIIPIINENDVVSDSEIRLMEEGISENDRLARMIAELIKADSILFLTKSGGVYEEDPEQNPNAKFYSQINSETAVRIANTLKGASENGTGGISAKLLEAAECAKLGMAVSIAGFEEGSILKFAKGEPVGTRIIN